MPRHYVVDIAVYSRPHDRSPPSTIALHSAASDRGRDMICDKTYGKRRRRMAGLARWRKPCFDMRRLEIYRARKLAS